MREIVHLQAGQCGNQIGAKVIGNIQVLTFLTSFYWYFSALVKTSMSKWVTSMVAKGDVTNQQRQFVFFCTGIEQ